MKPRKLREGRGRALIEPESHKEKSHFCLPLSGAFSPPHCPPLGGMDTTSITEHGLGQEKEGGGAAVLASPGGSDARHDHGHASRLLAPSTGRVKDPPPPPVLLVPDKDGKHWATVQPAAPQAMNEEVAGDCCGRCVGKCCVCWTRFACDTLCDCAACLLPSLLWSE